MSKRQKASRLKKRLAKGCGEKLCPVCSDFEDIDVGRTIDFSIGDTYYSVHISDCPVCSNTRSIRANVTEEEIESARLKAISAIIASKIIASR